MLPKLARILIRGLTVPDLPLDFQEELVEPYGSEEWRKVNQSIKEKLRGDGARNRGNRYFDVFLEYAKAGPEDNLVRMTAHTRSPEAARLFDLFGCLGADDVLLVEKGRLADRLAQSV